MTSVMYRNHLFYTIKLINNRTIDLVPKLNVPVSSINSSRGIFFSSQTIIYI